MKLCIIEIFLFERCTKVRRPALAGLNTVVKLYSNDDLQKKCPKWSKFLQKPWSNSSQPVTRQFKVPEKKHWFGPMCRKPKNWNSIRGNIFWNWIRAGPREKRKLTVKFNFVCEQFCSVYQRTAILNPLLEGPPEAEMVPTWRRRKCGKDNANEGETEFREWRKLVLEEICLPAWRCQGFFNVMKLELNWI